MKVGMGCHTPRLHAYGMGVTPCVAEIGHQSLLAIRWSITALTHHSLLMTLTIGAYWRQAHHMLVLLDSGIVQKVALPGNAGLLYQLMSWSKKGADFNRL